jgi:hypothetical protein
MKLFARKSLKPIKSVIALMASLPLLGACTISMPFTYGPLGNIGVPEELLQVSITHATLYPDKRDVFDQQTMVVYREMDKQSGLVAYGIRRELFGNQVWTVSVWRDHESRMKFFMSDVHQRAIYMSQDAIETVRYKRIDVQRRELPLTWDRVEQILKQPAVEKS